MPETEGTPSTAETEATAGTPTTPGTPAIAGTEATTVTKATVVTLAISNSQEYSNILTARNSRKRSTNIVGTPEKTGTIAKVVKPTTTSGENNYSRNTINIRSSRDNSASWMSSASGLPESVGKSATAEMPAKSGTVAAA